MLLDTSGLFSLLHKREPEHLTAKQVYANARTRLTHNYVLDELVSLAHIRRIPRRNTLDFSQQLLNDSRVETFWIDEELHQQALDLLFARPDKTYSLCDAVSFVLMRERDETEALTTDRHFEQEGFVRLLSP